MAVIVARLMVRVAALTICPARVCKRDTSKQTNSDCDDPRFHCVLCWCSLMMRHSGTSRHNWKHSEGSTLKPYFHLWRPTPSSPTD